MPYEILKEQILNKLKEQIGKQPTQTRENTTSIESVRDKLMPNIYGVDVNINKIENNLYTVTYHNEKGQLEIKEFDSEERARQFKKELGRKEYTSQALTNLKIAALKEVARKYPRSLITSKVVPINPNMVNNSKIQYSKRESIENLQNEINQFKQELERVEKEGFGALKPIYNFYENTVTNILKKQGYKPELITDEYGNTWNEVDIQALNSKFLEKIKNSFTFISKCE